MPKFCGLKDGVCALRRANNPKIRIDDLLRLPVERNVVVKMMKLLADE
jgi:hypothetical protein